MKGIIDRFEGNFAVVELDNGEIIDIERVKIPKEAKEGDVIDIGEEIKVDVEETKRVKDDIEKMVEHMWEEWGSCIMSWHSSHENDVHELVDR